MADETGSGEIAARRAQAAAHAALHSYRSVYGHKVRGGTETIVDALRDFWLARFGEGHPFPRWFSGAENSQTPAASEAASPPGSPFGPLGPNGWLGGLPDSKRHPLERK